MQGDKLVAKMYDHLFVSGDKQAEVFTESEQKVVARFRAVMALLYDDPWKPDVEVRNFLMGHFGLSESQAYRDIPKIKYLFGNVQLAAKEFHRMRANKLIEDAHGELNGAESKLDVLVAEAKIRAAVAYVKINNLDKEDKFNPRWEEINIPDYEVTDDVSVIEGKKPVPDLEEKKQQLRIELGIIRQVVQIEDVACEENKDGKTTGVPEQGTT